MEDILDDDTDESEEAAVEADTEQADVEEDTDVEEVNFKHMVQTEILNNYDSQQDDGEREATKNSSESDNDQDGAKAEEGVNVLSCLCFLFTNNCTYRKKCKAKTSLRGRRKQSRGSSQ